jgi:hypothetical protein
MTRDHALADLPPLLAAARRRAARHQRGAKKIAKPKNNYLAEKPITDCKGAGNYRPVGAPKGNANAVKTGHYGAQRRALRRRVRTLRHVVAETLAIIAEAVRTGVHPDNRQNIVEMR